MDFVEYVEKVMGIKLLDYQKTILRKFVETGYDNHVFMCRGGYMIMIPKNKQKVVSEMEDWILKSEPNYRYMLLDRLRTDCEYYLGNGNRSANHLWAGDEKRQIESMKIIWNSFPEEDKPEWLTLDQINEYAQKMGVDVDFFAK